MKTRILRKKLKFWTQHTLLRGLHSLLWSVHSPLNKVSSIYRKLKHKTKISMPNSIEIFYTAVHIQFFSCAVDSLRTVPFITAKRSSRSKRVLLPVQIHHTCPFLHRVLIQFAVTADPASAILISAKASVIVLILGIDIIFPPFWGGNYCRQIQ